LLKLSPIFPIIGGVNSSYHDNILLYKYKVKIEFAKMNKHRTRLPNLSIIAAIDIIL